MIDKIMDAIQCLFGFAIVLFGCALLVGIGFGGVAGQFEGARNMSTMQITLSLILLACVAIGLAIFVFWYSRKERKSHTIFIICTFPFGAIMFQGCRLLSDAIRSLKMSQGS